MTLSCIMKNATGHLKGQTFHNFNDPIYGTGALSPQSCSNGYVKAALTSCSRATEYKRYPKMSQQRITQRSGYRGAWDLSWVHTRPTLRHIRGNTEHLKKIKMFMITGETQEVLFYQDLSKDDDIPKDMQNDFLHQMYKNLER